MPPRGETALDLEPDHRSEARCLPPGEMVLRVRGEARIAHAIHLGCDSRNRAIAMALADWESMRTESVFTPWSVSQATCGQAMIPVAFWTKRTRSA